MSRVALKLPSQLKVIGTLRTPANPHYLDEDMLSIETPGGIFIVVGWHPACDASGAYQLNVCRGTYDRKIETPVSSKDYRIIVKTIYRMVSKYVPLVSPIAAPTASGSATVNGKVERNVPSFIRLSSATTERNLEYVA